MADKHIADTPGLRPGEATVYLGFLSKALEEIGSSLDFKTTLKNVAHAMVPMISDWCAIDIRQPDGSLKRLATAHIDPKKIAKASALGKKYPRDPHSASGTPHVLRTGSPDMHNGITDDMLAAAAINEEHLGMMRELQFYSIMIVPIKSRGKALGTITFVWAESAKTYSLADLAFAEILAAVAGSAIDNAQLFRAAKKAAK
jgi:GAF domain-containing protein